MGRSRIKRLRGTNLDIQFLVVAGKALPTRRYSLESVKSKCHWREKHLFSAMGAFHINCAVISFTQDLQFVLAIRAHSRHCNMAGILLFQFLLFCLNTGIALWIKFPCIDFCHTFSLPYQAISFFSGNISTSAYGSYKSFLPTKPSWDNLIVSAVLDTPSRFAASEKRS